MDQRIENRHIVAAGLAGVVHVWDVQTGKEIARSEELTEIIWSVAVSPDGRTVLTGGGSKRVGQGEFERGSDFALRLWQLPERESEAVIALLQRCPGGIFGDVTLYRALRKIRDHSTYAKDTVFCSCKSVTNLLSRWCIQHPSPKLHLERVRQCIDSTSSISPCWKEEVNGLDKTHGG